MVHPSGIYQTLQPSGHFLLHDHQSHIWLITTEISQVPHTNDLFKGTSSTRQGTVVFWLRPYQNKLRAGKGPSSPLLNTSCQANCLCHSNWDMLTAFLVNVHTTIYHHHLLVFVGRMCFFPEKLDSQVPHSAGRWSKPKNVSCSKMLSPGSADRQNDAVVAGRGGQTLIFWT